ncbi:hypothetical protein GCM10023325_17930 [Sphingomonas lutea]
MIFVAGAVAALTLTAAQRPSALAQASAGVWEVSGAPGAQANVRQCVADVATLAQFEHRQKSCKRNLLTESASSVVIQYECSGGDFGRSKVTVVTPRSLKIETQGISDRLPFSYTLQARRVGDCPERG